MSKKTILASALASALLTTTASAETFRWAFQGNIYDGLVGRDKDLNLIPGLAEKWENIELNRWRFTLRQGVKFHNDNDFNADDMVFSVERIRSEGSDLKVIAALIESVEKNR